MMLTLGAAARAVAVSKSTLARAIKAGRLSATRKPDGGYEIDAAELTRVYPLAVAPGETITRHVKPHADATSATAAGLAAEIAGLRELNTVLRDQLADTKQNLAEAKQDRDAWRTAAETAQRQLTDQRDQRPWWRRFRG